MEAVALPMTAELGTRHEPQIYCSRRTNRMKGQYFVLRTLRDLPAAIPQALN